MRHLPLRAMWRRSSHCTGNGGACIEVAQHGATVTVRDAKDCHGADYPVLRLDRASWLGLVSAVKTCRHRTPGRR